MKCEKHMPDYQAMGDCHHCGRVKEDHERKHQDNFKVPRFGISIEIDGAYSIEEAVSYILKYADVITKNNPQPLPDHITTNVKSWSR